MVPPTGIGFESASLFGRDSRASVRRMYPRMYPRLDDSPEAGDLTVLIEDQNIAGLHTLQP
jgi:hypothetical protein